MAWTCVTPYQVDPQAQVVVNYTATPALKNTGKKIKRIKVGSLLSFLTSDCIMWLVWNHKTLKLEE